MSLLIAVVMASGALVLTAATAPPAAALCSTPELQGDWRNIDANTRAITRAAITFHCDDVRLCDQYGNCTGGQSYYRINLYGRCSPTDCNWGQVTATDRGGGWLQATHHFGFKTSYVWLKTYAHYWRTYLRVYVDNRFAPGDGRANYVTDEWFLK